MPLLRRFAPRAIRRVRPERYRNSHVAIDLTLALYQLMGATPHVIRGATGQPINHIQGLLFRIIYMWECGIEPVFVFDGAPPPLKAGTLARRRREKLLARRRVRLGERIWRETETLLALLGVSTVYAPAEAEATAAVLTRRGRCDLTVTTDLDALAFGTPLLALTLTRPANKSVTNVVEVSLTGVLSGLRLSRAQFIDLCILCGSDYAPTIEGVGPVRALALLRRHGSIEGILRHEASLPITPAFRAAYPLARREFLHPPVAARVGRARLPDVAALRRFLRAAGMEPVRMENALARVRELKSK